MTTMPIHFIYSRREALTGKAEAYKKAVRNYLEAEGYSQTTDSFIEGSFQDMIFYNPTISKGKKFVVESKAEELSIKSKNLAIELMKYYSIWRELADDNKFDLFLFIQSVKNPSEWESLFSEGSNYDEVNNWLTWYDQKYGSDKLMSNEIENIMRFFKTTTVKVGNTIDLELAVLKKQDYSSLAINRIATKLLGLVYKRRNPIPQKSNIIFNILPVEIPPCYYEAKSSELNKNVIYNELRDKIVPPFILRRDGTIFSFSILNDNHPLSKYIVDGYRKVEFPKLQIANPSLSANLIYDHIRRIVWKKGIYRVPNTNIFYYPMLDTNDNKLEKINFNGNKRWVVKKFMHQEDTNYVKKGDINFFFHRAIELSSQNYWGKPYIELNPKRYYTLDGKTETEGEIRARIDSKFRNQLYDRSETRLDLLKFWKYRLFDSKEYTQTKEEWFDDFKFGDFIVNKVPWSPIVIGKDQTRLWDFGG